MHSESHEVLRVLAGRALAGSRPGKRDDALRVALAIEGGGMRGTVSAGMALALHELGLVTAFDAVYGSSAGAISGAWLLSSTPEGLRGWADPRYAKALIRRSRLLRRRPVVDVRALIEDVYQTVFPMDFGSVLGSPVEFHPMATDTATGQSADLRPLIRDPGRAASCPARQRGHAAARRPAGHSRRQAFLRRRVVRIGSVPDRARPRCHVRAGTAFSAG